MKPFTEYPFYACEQTCEDTVPTVWQTRWNPVTQTPHAGWPEKHVG